MELIQPGGIFGGLSAFLSLFFGPVFMGHCLWFEGRILLLVLTSTSTDVWPYDSGLDGESPCLQAPRCTWPAGGGGRLRGLTTPLFSPLDIQPLLSCSPWGGERSRWSLSSGSGLAAGSSGLQKNSCSLWHTLRHSIISFCPILSRVRSVFTGTCKITWQEQLKAPDRTSVPSVPQTFTNLSVSLKWRGHWKEVPVSVPKGQWLLNVLQSWEMIQ